MCDRRHSAKAISRKGASTLIRPATLRVVLAGTLGLIGLAGLAPAAPGADDAKAATPATAPTPEEVKLQQQLAEVRRDIERLEREAYQTNPKLKQLEDRKRTIEAERSAGQQRQVEVALYLQDQEGRNPAVRRVYQRLTSGWMWCTEIAYLRDPDKAELLKICLLEEAESERIAYLRRAYPELGDADLSTPEKFWEAFAATYAGLEQGARARLDADIKGSGFPPFVLDQARRVGESSIERRVVEAYLAKSTPRPLREARWEAHLLEIDLRNLQIAKITKLPPPVRVKRQ